MLTLMRLDSGRDVYRAGRKIYSKFVNNYNSRQICRLQTVHFLHENTSLLIKVFVIFSLTNVVRKIWHGTLMILSDKCAYKGEDDY